MAFKERRMWPGFVLSLVDAYARRPAGLLGLEVDLVGERVAALSGDGGDVIFVGVDKGDDFHGGCEEGLLHGSADFGSFVFRSRFSDSDFDCPSFPADLFVCAAKRPGLLAFSLEELDGDLAPSSAAAVPHARAAHSVSLDRCASSLATRIGQSFSIELALERICALLDQRLQLIVVDKGESDIQDLVRSGGERREESVKEDCVQYAFNHVANRSRVCKDVEYEFRGFLLIHFFFPGEQGSRGW